MATNHRIMAAYLAGRKTKSVFKLRHVYFN